MKKTNRISAALCLLFFLCSPSLCFGEGVDGVFWNKMDKIQKVLLIMGYKMGSEDAIMTLNTLIALNKEVESQRKADKNPELEEISKISAARCAALMNLTRKALIRETYIPEEDLERIVTALDAFYSSRTSLKIRITDAISKIREEMYERNPSIEKALKPRDTDRRK